MNGEGTELEDEREGSPFVCKGRPNGEGRPPRATGMCDCIDRAIVGCVWMSTSTWLGGPRCVDVRSGVWLCAEVTARSTLECSLLAVVKMCAMCRVA